jgi:hypothetical protein
MTSDAKRSVGKNGVVFETARPDDPVLFANRFKRKMSGQDTISPDLDLKKAVLQKESEPVNKDDQIKLDQ